VAELHVVTALRAKHAELAGEIQAAQKRVDQLRADLMHVDAVLRLFDSGAESAGTPAKRPYRRRKGWFSDGELPRRVLDTLRTSPKPLSASAITASVMSAKGLDTGDAATLLVMHPADPSEAHELAGRPQPEASHSCSRTLATGRATGPPPTTSHCTFSRASTRSHVRHRQGECSASR
jgi:hypothetical protein